MSTSELGSGCWCGAEHYLRDDSSSPAATLSPIGLVSSLSHRIARREARMHGAGSPERCGPGSGGLVGAVRQSSKSTWTSR